jgi:hypothetical protein
VRKVLSAACLGASLLPALCAQDWLDRLDDSLTVALASGAVRARLSGTAELEAYHFQQPPPGLIRANGDNLLNPRLVLYLDAQVGGHFYFFVQSRADGGFDPGTGAAQVRLDEYALRFTPMNSPVFNLQVGKFATVVGNWVPRHQSWDNPFITAPLPYENPTGIFDTGPAGNVGTLLAWAGVTHLPPAVEKDFAQYRLPVIWGPSYATGATATGRVGRIDYAVEFKNAALASRPYTWPAGETQWQNPTVSTRVGWRPDERWNLGVSFSSGTYLQPSAATALPPGRSLHDYREIVVGQDVGFAWHHFQFWAEGYSARFTNPDLGGATTFAYYLEAKYKFTPRFFGAVRWNQQLFGRLADPQGGSVKWGRDVWRLEWSAGYRFTPHAQLKLQYSLEDGRPDPGRLSDLLAAQFVLRF